MLFKDKELISLSDPVLDFYTSNPIRVQLNKLIEAVSDSYDDIEKEEQIFRTLIFGQEQSIREIFDATPLHFGEDRTFLFKYFDEFVSGKSLSNTRHIGKKEREERALSIEELMQPFLENYDLEMLNEYKFDKKTLLHFLSNNLSRYLSSKGIKDEYIKETVKKYLEKNRPEIFDYLTEEEIEEKVPFEIKETKVGLVCFSIIYKHASNSRREIIKELQNKRYYGKVIFDGLTASGDESNRFLSVMFDGYDLNFRKAEIIEDNEELRKICNQFYMDNFERIQYNCILSPSILADIQDGSFE